MDFLIENNNRNIDSVGPGVGCGANVICGANACGINSGCGVNACTSNASVCPVNLCHLNQ